MSTQPTPEQAHRGWLRNVRLFATLCLLLLLSAAAVAVGESNIVFAIMSGSLALCYLMVLWLIRSNPPRKSGLALAVGAGSILSLASIQILVSSLLPLEPATSRSEFGLLAFSGSFAITSVGGVTSAIKTYYSLRRETGDIRTLALGFAIPVIILVLLALAIPQFL